jgi:hypothetical protein
MKNDDVDARTRTGTPTDSLTASSNLPQLAKKIARRFTIPGHSVAVVRADAVLKILEEHVRSAAVPLPPKCES